MPRRLLGSLVLTTAILLAGAFASGAGAAVIQVVRPGTDQFFASAPVTVELKTAKSAHSISAKVGGKNVSRAFKKAGGGIWRAKLGAKQLKGGSNLLSASAVAASGKREYTSIRFVLGRRKRSLLAIEGPRRGGPMVVRVRVHGTPERLTAKLNGRRVSWPFGLVAGRREVLRLGADDGLHYGTNHLRVTAIGAGGIYDVESRKVFVPRKGPIAGAGRDRRVVAGRRVRLDGTSTLTPTTPTSLSYSWTIVGKPLGSQATLLEAGSSQPLLRTDLPGTYQVQLQVTELVPGGEGALRTATDVTTITSTPTLPPIGEPIETMASNAKGESGIKVGEKLYPLGAGKAFQMVLLNRQTLAYLGSASYTDGEVGQAAQAMKSAGNESIVALSYPTRGGGAANAELLALAKSLGVEEKPIESGRPGWSVVGVPGTTEAGYLAAGASAGNPRGNLSGYLQRMTTIEERGTKNKEVVETDAFGFVPGGQFVFETSAPGPTGLHNKITVGSKSYESSPLAACATGGFQVEVLLAETLAPVGGQSFATAGCADATNLGELQKMTAYLNAITTSAPAEGPKLVFVQSIGSRSIAAGEQQAWREAGNAIARLGGTASVFDLPVASLFVQDVGYSLVGQVGITGVPLAEASESLTGQPAKLAGLLKQNRVGAYLPMLSGATSGTNFKLAAIAYQEPEAWPASQSPGEKAALKYIANDVLELEQPRVGAACYVPAEPDVRSEYCNLTYRTLWGTFEGKVERASYVAGQGFEKPEWEAVTKELTSGEMTDVQLVWTYIKELQKVFGVVGGSGEVQLKNTVSSIEASIDPKDKEEIRGWFLEFLGNLGAVGSYFAFGTEGEYIQKVLGIFQGSMFEAASTVSTRAGDPLLENYKVRANELAEEISKHYVEASSQLGKLGEIFVSDHGKLTDLRKDELLGINEEALKKVREGAERGTKLWSYETLMPAAYEAVQLKTGFENETLSKAGEYQCNNGTGYGSWVYKPFEGIATAAELNETQNQPPSIGVLVRLGSRLPKDGTDIAEPDTPPAKVMAPLVQGGSRLGYFPEWFWRSSFNYPDSKTKSIGC